MCKSVLFAAASVLSLATGVLAQTARLDVQVSTDNVTWSDALFAPAGSNVFVRVVASTTAPNAVGLAGITLQPTLTGWTGADTRMVFSNASSGAAATNNSGVPANTGRMYPYGAVSMAPSSGPGLLTSFNDSGVLRIAGSRATSMGLNPDYGVVCSQNPKSSYPNYSQANSCVIVKYGLQLSSNTTLREMIADVPLAGIKNSRISWFTTLTSTGNPINITLTAADIDPATISVGPPNTAPTAVPESFNMLEDETLVITTGSVLNNDTDPDANETKTAELVSTTARGALTFNADGTFAYNPQRDFNGVDSFTYRVRDRYNVGSNVATVTLNVTDINDEPTFAANDPAITTEDSGQRTIANWAAFNPGPGESQGVLEYEVMSIGNPNLFAMGGWPNVSADGTLRYTPAANASGVASFEVRVRDSGGTNNGGSDMSEPQVFNINVLPVNDAPVVTTAPVGAVREDAGQQSIPGFAAFNPGPAEADQVLLGYAVSNVSNPSLFSLFPTVAPDGTLVFTPAANAVGTSTFTLTARDSGGTVNGGSDTSAPQVLSITVSQVNDAPSFSAAAPVTILEDAPAQTINNWATFSSGGGAAEASQAVSAYVISNVSNPSLFAAGPSVSNSGVLTYTPAANANGSATFSVQVRDNGGTADGGVDTSIAQTFTINVTAVNDAPSFSAPSTTSITEDAGAQTLTNWATFNPGAGEAGQAVSAYTLSNLTNSALFSVAPSIGNDGTLSYTTAPNASGTATFQLRVRDNGGVASGGVDLSPTQTFTISVAAVNDAPTVALDPMPTILEDAGAQSLPGFTVFNAGPGEASQSLVGYVIGNISDPSLFAVAPSLPNSGTLTYMPAANASGTVSFTVQARDNGGTANGGSDLSEPALATLNITPVNDAPAFAAANPPASNEDGGSQTIENWSTFNAGPGESSQGVLAYTISNLTNASLFAVQPSVSVDGTLAYTAAANASGTSTFQVRVRDNGGVTSGGIDTSVAQSFSITVNSVNDAPSVSLNAIPTIVEDGGSQVVGGFASFNAGPGETQSLLGYTVSNISNPAMFASGPNVSNSGTLTYTPSPNASGSVTFTVAARDSGGTANGGIDTSVPALATINITNVNDAPSFAAANPPVSNEDAGLVSVSNWSSFNPGPFEVGQTAEYTVTAVGNASLFSTPPSVGPDGTLSYVTAPNVSGTSTFTVRVRDNGGTASGGQDTSGTQTFTISVNSVNDAPEVTLSSLPVIEEDSAAQVVPGFASFAAGAGETGQSAVEYLVSDLSNPAAFSVAPSVSPAGVLSYTPAPDASGTITFRVRVRDSGGTANGGQDLSLPALATLTINGVNDPPVVAARNITIDARTGCVGLTVAASQVNNGSYDPDNGPAELTFRLSRSGEFPVGSTPVTLTVTDAGGLSSSANATVTVLANDVNHNTIPDSCDAVRGGGGPDCDEDGDSDESVCLWDNGLGAPGQNPPDGQLSQYGGGSIAARVADDFYLLPGLLYRLTSFRGQILTSSIERTARLQFFRDCDGRPADEPFATFESSNIAGESEGQGGKMLVTYIFEFCDDKFVLEGDNTYWVSLQGKVNCNITDQAFWASSGSEADPLAMVASVPYKALGLGDHPCTVSSYDAWESIADCCIGCANMAYSMTGSACQLAWDNGPVDLGPTRGGDPSGINRGIFSRAADSFVVKPCRTETICWIEAYIWTNCTPVFGFLELYDNSCSLPTGAFVRRITPSDIIELDEHAVIDGVSYRLVKLEFWNIPWTLTGGKNYWLSVGADGAGSFNARSFFAYSDPNAPCGCHDRRIVYGATKANRQSDDRWLRSNREYAFRIATKPFFMDPIEIPARQCPQDVNEDGIVTVGDLLTFLQEFFIGCP